MATFRTPLVSSVGVLRAYERWTRTGARGGIPVQYSMALSCTALVTLIMALSGLALEPANISLIYLLAVLFTATTAGLGPGIVASVLSFLAYNFFFVEPLYVLTVDNPQNVVRLISFLIAAILASSLAGLVHRQTEQLGQRAAELESLYAVSQTTSAQVDLDRILPVLATTAVELLHARSCVLSVQIGAGERVFGAPPMAPDVEQLQPTIIASLRVEDRSVGSMRVQPQPHQIFHAPERRLVDLLASQAALAVERARLVSHAAGAQALVESDRLKSALLSSVSHDLRTPLVAIKGIATALRQRDVVWDSAAGGQMLDTLAEEADRLNRLVGNLLDMSRIESGALHPAREWEDLGEIVGGVLSRMRPQLHDRTVNTHLPANLPQIWVNATLIDQVLTNLVENTFKYTPAQTPLTIDAEVQGNTVQVRVIDQGLGIAADALPHIFDTFFRVVGPERHADDTGLGLAICQGIVEAHGGSIWASNRPQGGAAFIFTLPLHPAGVGRAPTLDELDSLVTDAEHSGVSTESDEAL
jgi:two-component system, OmpR family, sensor histidine kinase KdpD